MTTHQLYCFAIEVGFGANVLGRKLRPWPESLERSRISWFTKREESSNLRIVKQSRPGGHWGKRSGEAATFL